MRKPSEISTAFSPTEALDGKTSFFLVGIGGAGMSALARMLAHRGFTVRGTDSTPGAETARLMEEGIGVQIGHSGEGLLPEDVVVLTDAIDLDASPEVARAKALGLPMVRRSQALGWVLRPYKTICVTGTHGKTTTTGMIGAGLIAAGLDPTVVVGAAIPQWGSPVREGSGEWAVVEACEAYDSFHDLRPDVVVLTNLELDHVDFHGTWENLRGSVVRFVDRLKEARSGGTLIFCGDDAGAREIAENAEVASVAYGLGSFDEHFGALAIPGDHNRLNASGALAACVEAGADPAKAAEGIAGFHGAERRLQVLAREDVTIVDDYAHHPTEIEASLKALREQVPGRLIVVYQPHLYSRTAPLIDEFAAALSHADLVVLTDIYPAREAPMAGVSSARIAEKVKVPVRYVPSRHLLPRFVNRLLQKGDVVVGMGAGNISEFGPELIHERARPGKQVAVLYGGDSPEREVSLHSGRAVQGALSSRGYDAFLFDVSERALARGDLSALVGSNRPDVCFLAVHGTNAEDGAIQGLLQLLHLPYTGSGILASAIALDKAETKDVLAAAGVRVPKGVLVRSSGDAVDIEGPWIVKPNCQGSTVGLSFVEQREDLQGAIEKALAYDESALVEEWLKGMEISTPVLNGEALLPVEIAPKTERYDFASKYLPGATEEIIPARLPDAVLKEAQEIALRAHQALGCAGATRTDAIIVDPHGNAEIVVLEVNTLPGMTATSLLPNSAAAAGIPFEELCERIVQEALSRYETAR